MNYLRIRLSERRTISTKCCVYFGRIIDQFSPVFQPLFLNLVQFVSRLNSLCKLAYLHLELLFSNSVFFLFEEYLCLHLIPYHFPSTMLCSYSIVSSQLSQNNFILELIRNHNSSITSQSCLFVCKPFLVPFLYIT